jgi:hypothetical protein
MMQHCFTLGVTGSDTILYGRECSFGTNCEFMPPHNLTQSLVSLVTGLSMGWLMEELGLIPGKGKSIFF